MDTLVSLLGLSVWISGSWLGVRIFDCLTLLFVWVFKIEGRGLLGSETESSWILNESEETLIELPAFLIVFLLYLSLSCLIVFKICPVGSLGEMIEVNLRFFKCSDSYRELARSLTLTLEILLTDFRYWLTKSPVSLSRFWISSGFKWSRILSIASPLATASWTMTDWT